MSLLDVNAMKIVREVSVGRRLSGVASSESDRTLLLATDEEPHDLVVYLNSL